MFFLIKHSILEGLKNLGRSFWLSITAIFVITVSLSSVALIASLWVTVGFTLRQFDNQISINVFLKDDVAREFIEVMEKDLKNLKEVREVEFIDKVKAREKLKNNPTTAQIYNNLNKISENTDNQLNLLQEYFQISPENSESYSVVENFVKQEKYSGIVEEVIGTRDYINVLQRIYYWSGIIGSLMVIIFALLSILVMANILRIAIYNRKGEIEIMRLVGATNNYIRGPFIAEGVLYNLSASLIVLIIFMPSFNFLIPQIEVWLGIQTITNSNDLLIWMYGVVGVTILSGIIIGAITSLFATQKYLKL